MVVTDDRILYDNLLALRAHGWTRDLGEDSHLPIDPDPFQRQFRFVLPGYNLRPLEMEGALGRQQLLKLPGFVSARRDNGKFFQSLFADMDSVDIQHETGESSWFGFALVLKGRLAGRRGDLVRALAAAEIESRPVVAGNFLNNPVISKLDHSVASNLPAAERIDRDGLFTGNHNFPIRPQIERLRQVVEDVAKGV